MLHRSHKECGINHKSVNSFTLVEIAIASALVLILFVGVYLTITQAFAVTRASREDLRATQILLERMEGIRLYNWYQLTASNWIPRRFQEYYYPITNLGPPPGIVYYGEFIVTNAPFITSYADEVRLVIVRLWWTNWVGGAPMVKMREMWTLVAKKGLQNYIYYN